VRLNVCDIRDVNAVNTLVAGQDFVFHLAGQVDHILRAPPEKPADLRNVRDEVAQLLRLALGRERRESQKPLLAVRGGPGRQRRRADFISARASRSASRRRIVSRLS